MTTWNPNDKAASVFVDFDQVCGPASPAWGSVRATTSKTQGYFEVDMKSLSPSASVIVGVADANFNLNGYPGQSANSAGVQWATTPTKQPRVSGVVQANGFSNVPTSVFGDVPMIYVDAGNVWFGRNGVWTSGDPALGTAPNVTGFINPVFPTVGTYDAMNIVKLNTGGPFKYPPPGPAWDSAPTPTFFQVSELHLNLQAARPLEGDIFVNSVNNVGPPAGVFTTLNLALIDPLAAGATVAIFSGIEVITGGSTPEVEDLGIIFRAPGDTQTLCAPAFFVTQAAFQVNSGASGGIRQSARVRVPVVGGCVEWAWFRSTTAAYPASAAYGFNFWLDSWAK
jgi:hypothetical protein